MNKRTGSASKKYHFVYKTTCLVNGFIYIGVRSTNEIEDGYLGSGQTFVKAKKLYGKHNFKREILEFFNSRDEAEDREEELVDREFLKRKDVYNKIPGGGKRNTLGMVVVKDMDGRIEFVSVDDPRYLSGELVPNATGMVAVTDTHGNNFQVAVNDPRYISGELVSTSKGRVVVKAPGGGYMSVNTSDPRYVSGELEYIHTGGKRSEEFIAMLKRIHTGKVLSVETRRKVGLASKGRVPNALGRLRLSLACKGKRWICNVLLKKNRMVKDSTVTPEGWVEGRLPVTEETRKKNGVSAAGRIWCHNAAGEHRMIRPIDGQMPDGWIIGRLYSKNPDQTAATISS